MKQSREVNQRVFTKEELEGLNQKLFEKNLTVEVKLTNRQVAKKLG